MFANEKNSPGVKIVNIFLFSIPIFLLLSTIECQVNFTMTTDKKDLVFGESLTISVAMALNENLDNVKLEIRLKPKLQYKANITSATCTPQTACKVESTVLSYDQVPQASSAFTFDSRIIEKSQIMTLVQNGTAWHIGRSYSAVIVLDNLATGELSGFEFVIAFVTYWNPKTQTDNGVQMFLGRNFTLVPARLNLTIDDLPATNMSLRTSYVFADHNITLSAEIDTRGLPILLQITLPVTLTGNQTCNPDCTKSNFTNRLMTVTKEFYVTQNKVEFLDPGDQNPLIIKLTSDMFGGCNGACKINFTATVKIIPELVKIGKQLIFQGEARYGDHFVLKSPTEPGLLTIIGPDLNIDVSANPRSDLEAGNVVDFGVVLNHSRISSDDLYITYFEVNFNQPGLELVSNSAKQTKNDNGAIQLDDNKFVINGLVLGDLALRDNIKIQFKIRLNDNVLVWASIPVDVGADYSYKKSTSSCTPSPCLNGGVCQTDKCLCVPGYKGTDCSERDCKSGFVPNTINNACYYDSSKSLPYLQAESVCVSNGGHLPSVHSIADGKALYSLLKQKNLDGIWIGLRRASGGWQWEDGTPYDKSNWAPYEPRDGVNCAVWTLDRKWRTQNCSADAYFYCTDQVRSGMNIIFSTHVVTNLKTKSINVQSPVSLPDRLQIHQPVQIHLDFTLPLGTLANVDLLTVFTSSDTNKIPIMFMDSKLTLPDYVSMSKPGLKNYNSTDFVPLTVDQVSPTARARRSVNGIRSVQRLVGNLTNPAASGRSGAPVSLNATFLNPVNNLNVSGIRFNMELILQYNDASYQLYQKSSMLVDSYLIMSKYLQPDPNSPGNLQVITNISHSSNSTGPAYNLEYMDDLDCLKLSNQPSGSVYDPTCSAIRIKRDVLDINDTIRLLYSISADKNLAFDPSYRNATLNFSSIKPGEFVYIEYPGKKGSVEVSTCLFRKDDVTVMEYLHDHRWSILAFILGIILAFLLCFLLLYLCSRCKRRSRVNPSEEEELLANAEDDAGSYNGSERRKSVKGVGVSVDTMTDFRDESIVLALTEPSPQGVSRHLDRIDVYDNAKIEDSLNAEKLKTMVDSAANAFEPFITNGSVSRSVGDEFASSLKKQFKNASDEIDNEKNSAIDKLKKTMSVKIGTEMEKLRAKFETEKRDIATKTKDLPNDEKEETLKLLKMQQQAEMDDLLHKLALEQEAELQNLKQQCHAKKEAMLLAIQSKLLRDFSDGGKITPETSDELQHNLDELNQDITKWYDGERARQRAALEELFLKRRHLALQKEMWDAQNDEIVNLLLRQFMDTISFLESKGIISASEAKKLKQEVQNEIEKLKAWLEKERRERELNLHKKSSLERKKRYAEIKQSFDQKLNELNSKKVSTDAEMLDLIREKQKLKSSERKALNELNASLDQTEAEALENLYKDLQREFNQKLDEKRQKLFTKYNVKEEVVDQIMRDHRERVRIMEEKNEFQRQKLVSHLREVLKERKAQLLEKADKEIEEQNELRNQQRIVAKKLLNQQSSLSDEDRDKLIKMQMEHLARLNNSLALNKINQMQTLQDKLVQRKLSLMERLENKRLRKASLKNIPENIDSDNSLHEDKDILSLSMRDYVAEKLRIVRDTHFDVDKELNKIQKDLSHKRTQQLKEQDTAMGALIAQLQISKAKQIAQLEQQEDALQSLTTCMVEELNDRGILSNPDCHRILEKHQQEQEKVNEKLKDQKEKQELILQQELSLRAAKKREIMEKRMQNKLKTVHFDKSVNDVGRQIDAINLIHEQALEKEIEASSAEREMEQEFSEKRREFDLKIKQALQDQEIGLIDNLIQMGKFSKTEVSRVLRILFPDKSKQEIKTLVKNVYGTENSKEQPADNTKKEDVSNRLEKRLIQRTFETDSILNERGTSSDGLVGTSRIQKTKRKHKTGYRPKSRPRTHLPPISKRPEPVGASVDQVAEFLPDKRMVNKVPNKMTAAHL